jgi:hypothetical protein
MDVTSWTLRGSEPKNPHTRRVCEIHDYGQAWHVCNAQRASTKDMRVTRSEALTLFLFFSPHEAAIPDLVEYLSYPLHRRTKSLPHDHQRRGARM